MIRKKRLFLFLATFLTLSAVSLLVLQNFPNSGDESAYIFQARNLADFKLYSTLHPQGDDGFHLQQYFYAVHIGENDWKYYGRFPFGYSLLLVPAVWVQSFSGIDIFWMTNVLLGTLTILLFFELGRIYFDEQTGWLAAALAFITPWFLLTSGSFFSHTACTFFLTLWFYLTTIGFREENNSKRTIYFFLAGLSFGYAVLTRYLDPLAFVLPGMLFFFSEKGKRWKDIFGFGAGGLICLLALLGYNWKLTGDPFLTGLQFLNRHDSGTRFIFQTETGLDFSRILSVGWQEQSLPNLKLLKTWFVPAYLILLFPLAVWKFPAQRKLLIFCVLSACSILLLYTLYGGPPINQYGPRYFYAALFPLTLLAASGARALLLTRARYLFGIPILICILLGSLYYGVRHSMDFYSQINERRNLYRTVAAYDLKRSVIFLTTPSGSMHMMDLTRNFPDFSNDILYVQTLGGDYGPLIRYYNDRSFYEYKYSEPGKLGELTPLEIFSDGNFKRLAPLKSE